MDMHDAIVAAVTSVASHGDTDVLPFPFECHLFHDEPPAGEPSRGMP